ncbi:hypothetical protein PLANTIT3_60699 [Plantibacter sp. T3]|nr:hypothetical protein PLANTIT3_60699 [Plantibacter sp. T3]
MHGSRPRRNRTIMIAKLVRSLPRSGYES